MFLNDVHMIIMKVYSCCCLCSPVFLNHLSNVSEIIPVNVRCLLLAWSALHTELRVCDYRAESVWLKIIVRSWCWLLPANNPSNELHALACRNTVELSLVLQRKHFTAHNAGSVCGALMVPGECFPLSVCQSGVKEKAERGPLIQLNRDDRK